MRCIRSTTTEQPRRSASRAARSTASRFLPGAVSWQTTIHSGAAAPRDEPLLEEALAEEGFASALRAAEHEQPRAAQVAAERAARAPSAAAGGAPSPPPPPAAPRDAARRAAAAGGGRAEEVLGRVEAKRAAAGGADILGEAAVGVALVAVAPRHVADEEGVGERGGLRRVRPILHRRPHPSRRLVVRPVLPRRIHGVHRDADAHSEPVGELLGLLRVLPVKRALDGGAVAEDHDLEPVGVELADLLAAASDHSA